MTVKECYEAMGGNYDEVISRLRADDRVQRFLIKVAEDASYNTLCSAFEAGNIEEAFRAAHTLKGICMNLSLTRLAASASDLTESLRGKTEIEPIAEALLQEVKADYENTVKYINQLR